jgi:hypothetical protein
MTLLLAALLLSTPDDPVLEAAKVAKLPAVDGKEDEAWKAAKALEVPMGVPEEKAERKATLKALHDGEAVCILVRWTDETRNAVHQTYSWGLADEKYLVQDDAEYEDACSLGFALEGTFNPDMLAAVEAKWDVWHWGADRSSGGYALDMWHLYTKKRPETLKVKQKTARDESTIYLGRYPDEGTPPFRVVEPPKAKGADKVAQFAVQKPAGSAGDVEARGIHADNAWTVEFKRKLKTGQKDDVAIDPAKPLAFCLATFDNKEKADHDVSHTIQLKLK